jgi:hypothetical protein
MSNIELNLEGVTAVARLLEKEAPKTCQALWSVLPFEDMVIHSHCSGGRLHTTNHPKLNLATSGYPLVENPSAYQGPGDVVVWTATSEITVCYSPGQFRWMGNTWVTTKVAVIEGDMSDFARKMERLQWEGSKKLVIRHARGEEKPKPMAIGSGARITIGWKGKRWVAELFEDKAPKTCRAILNALPLEGPITNMHSSGEVFHYWPEIPGTSEKVETSRERRPVDYQDRQIGTSAIAFYDPRDIRGTNRGDIMFSSMEGIRIVHGEVQVDQVPFSGPSGSMGWSQKIGRIIEGNLNELHEISKNIDRDGAQILRMTRA